MTTFDAGAGLLTLAAVLGLINDRWFGVPRNIALLIGALLTAGTIIVIGDLRGDGDAAAYWGNRIEHANLSGVLLNGVLALMLFAGSLHVDLKELRARAWPVLLLATGGVALSAGLFGGGMYLLFPLAGMTVPFVWCLVLGAIVAPTDAVVVEGLLRQVRMPAQLRAIISGESLFNDGAAIVFFLAGLALAGGETGVVGHGRLAVRILIEVAGGGLLGWAAGALVVVLARGLKDRSLELTLSLALALGVYRLALTFDLSGPIAVVAAGLAYRNTRWPGRAQAEQLTVSWSAIDDLLNTLLFLLMGFQILAVQPGGELFLALPLVFVVALASRGVSVSVAMAVLHMPVRDKLRGVGVLTWTGLRGGISIALALTLPDTPYRAHLLAVAYAVVIMTIVIQGLTVPVVLRALYRPAIAQARPEQTRPDQTRPDQTRPGQTPGDTHGG
jgi:CPA1 family monovalent cation:H+ antiporter